CFALLFAAQALRAQETKERVTVDDVDRNFMVRLPKGYDPQQHYPVVILLHGMNQDPEDIERLTRFNELADKDGIITVYPAALHGRWNVGVRPQERGPTTMGPGRGGRRGGGGYPGGGYPGGGGGGQSRRGGWGIPSGRRTAAPRGPAERGEKGGSCGRHCFLQPDAGPPRDQVFGRCFPNLRGGLVRRRLYEPAPGVRLGRSNCGDCCSGCGDAEDDDLSA